MIPVVAALAVAAAVWVIGSPTTQRRPRPSQRTVRSVVPLLARPLTRLLDPVAVRLARRRQAAAEVRSVEADLPDLVDLLVLATAAGLTIPASLPTLVRWGPASLTTDLRRVQADIDLGERAATAFGALGQRWGDPAKPFVGTVVSHLADGTPLEERLARVARDARVRRQRSAEARARRLPVVLLFPLVLCVLPAFGLLTVAPLVAGTFRSLSGEPFEATASIFHPSEVSQCTPSSPYSSPPQEHGPVPATAASPPPSTHSSSSALPPSPSSSSPGPVGPTPSPACSTP